MRLYDTFDRHADLVARMADTLGADLGAAAAEGCVRPEELRSNVLRCIACDETEACAHWLAEHADGADAAPGYCRNKAVLERIARL